MAFLNTIVEYEGVVIDVRPRYWAAHRQALETIRLAGPTEDEFWRLFRTGSPESAFIQPGRPHHVAEYVRVRDQRINSTDLMALDTAPPGAQPNLRLLKQMGACPLAPLCDNRQGINATLDRLDLWIHFDKKVALPKEKHRRADALKDMIGQHPCTLAVAGSVPFAYAAGQAGARVVGMKTGIAFPKNLRQVGVDVFFDSLDELTDAITRRDENLQRIGLIY
jgi:phosphoglycolate phosphatase-like HAD superfamily hydrolase